MGEVPGLMGAPAGTFEVYQHISAHPTVALVMEIVKAIVRNANWDWTPAARGADAHSGDAEAEARVAAVETQIGPLAPAMVGDALRGLEYGFAPFEVVWGRSGARMAPVKIKPLNPRYTKILVDGGGNLRGVINHAPGHKPVELATEQCFVFTHDGEFGNLYGRSRHENVREDWAASEQVAQRLAQYLKKVSGIIPQLHYPEGTSKDENGADRPNFWIGQRILEMTAAGRGVLIPNRFASMLSGDGGHVSPAAMEKALAAAGKSEWVLSFLDAGGADHTKGFLETLAYYDKRLFRGWLRPERVGLEAMRGGSRADTKQHSETGVADSQSISREIARQFCEQVVDTYLALNFGHGARGSVVAEPKVLDAQTQQRLGALLNAMVEHGEAKSVWGQLDKRKLYAQLGVEMTPEA
jgi:hypothetical protein